MKFTISTPPPRYEKGALWKMKNGDENREKKEKGKKKKKGRGSKKPK